MESYCVAVRVVNNHCVATRQVSHPITVVTREAGYQDLYRKFDAPALDTRSVLKNPFARFKVASGQIALVDGFFADYPNADLDVGGCVAPSQGRMRCPVTSYAMTRLPASLSGFSELVARQGDWAERYPKLVAALRSVKAVATDIDAVTSDVAVDQGVGYRQVGRKSGTR